MFTGDGGARLLVNNGLQLDNHSGKYVVELIAGPRKVAKMTKFG